MATSLNPTAVAVDTSLTVIADADGARKSLWLSNTGSVDTYIANDGDLTSSNGQLLAAGKFALVTGDTASQAWYARCASSSTTVRWGGSSGGSSSSSGGLQIFGAAPAASSADTTTATNTTAMSAVLGTTADAATTTDTTGTIKSALRGLVKHAFERMPASLGQKTAAASLPVVLPSDDALNTAIGTQASAAQTNPATNASLIAYIRGILTVLADAWSDALNSLRVSGSTTEGIVVPGSPTYHLIGGRNSADGTGYVLGVNDEGRADVQDAAVYGKLVATGSSAIEIQGSTDLGNSPAGKPVLIGANTFDGVSVLSGNADIPTGSGVPLHVSPIATGGVLYENSGAVLAASAAHTTTHQSEDQYNRLWKGLTLIVQVTSAGTGSMTPSLEIKAGVSPYSYKTVWTASAALTADGTYAYHFYPGASGGSYTEVVPSGLAGYQWRLVMTHNNANSMTYSTEAVLLL